MISSLWLEIKYANMMSPLLDRFTVKKHSPYNAQFRCPICGDSKKNRLKARGYFVEKEGRIRVYCHNGCNLPPFNKFMESLSPSLHSEFRLERLKEFGQRQRPKTDNDINPEVFITKKPSFDRLKPLKSLAKISELSQDHFAAVYVRDERNIPERFFKKLYFAPKFCNWVNSLVPDKFSEQQLKYDEPRLIIPFLDEDGYVFGFQGRSFKKETNLRYMTIMLDESKPKVFGLDTVDFTKTYCILEGPIDAMFVDNCIALAGSDGSIFNTLCKRNGIVVYDNEPRNREIVKKISRSIDNGFRTVIWPKSLKQKDINDLVLSGLSISEVERIIHNNSYRGLAAKSHLITWKKV